METGLLGTVKWKLENDTLTLEPQNGDEGIIGEEPLDDLIDGIDQIKHVKTKGILHCEGEVLENMFDGFEELRTANLSALETSKAVSTCCMFRNCTKLRTVNLSSFDTSYIYNMETMFSNCINLKKVNLSNFDTHNVEYMNNMFFNCCSLRSLDLSNFDTSKLKDATNMFYSCSELERIDFSKFSPVSIENYGFGLSDCSVLKEIIIPERLEKQYNLLASLYSCDVDERLFCNSNLFAELLVNIEELTGCDFTREKELVSMVVSSNNYNEIWHWKIHNSAAPDERLLAIIEIIKHSTGKLTKNNIKSVMQGLETSGAVSDIKAYLNGVPLEDILA